MTTRVRAARVKENTYTFLTHVAHSTLIARSSGYYCRARATGIKTLRVKELEHRRQKLEQYKRVTLEQLREGTLRPGALKFGPMNGMLPPVASPKKPAPSGGRIKDALKHNHPKTVYFIRNVIDSGPLWCLRTMHFCLGVAVHVSGSKDNSSIHEPRQHADFGTMCWNSPGGRAERVRAVAAQLAQRQHVLAGLPAAELQASDGGAVPVGEYSSYRHAHRMPAGRIRMCRRAYNPKCS